MSPSLIEACSPLLTIEGATQKSAGPATHGCIPWLRRCAAEPGFAVLRRKNQHRFSLNTDQTRHALYPSHMLFSWCERTGKQRGSNENTPIGRAQNQTKLTTQTSSSRKCAAYLRHGADHTNAQRLAHPIQQRQPARPQVGVTAVANNFCFPYSPSGKHPTHCCCRIRCSRGAIRLSSSWTRNRERSWRCLTICIRKRQHRRRQHTRPKAKR